MKSTSPRPLDEHPFELRHEVSKLNKRLDKISHNMEKSELNDILENYSNFRKRLLSNFTAGLARGLGMTVGTALVVALLGWVLSQFLTVPGVGKLISDLLDSVDKYRN